MDIQHLRYLTVIWQAGSITQAAKKLYMSQPNLSRAVKEIEQETGFPIFRRTPHGAVPTRKGLLLLNYAQKILSQMDEMESLYKPARGDVLPLQVCVPPAPGFLWGSGNVWKRCPSQALFLYLFWKPPDWKPFPMYRKELIPLAFSVIPKAAGNILKML